LKRLHGAAVCVMAMATSIAWAAPRSVTLDIPGMTCPTCPVTIKKALMKEQGVTGVAVHYEKKELVVAFDDAKTTPAAIMKSTAAVGFPSQIAK
jgi:mercuric ion binding protein